LSVPLIRFLQHLAPGSTDMPAQREPGATAPSGRRGLALTAIGSGLAATLTLAFPLLEALTIALGVAALTSGIGAWMRSTPTETLPRALACLGAVLGTIALIVAVGRVDTTIINIDRKQLEHRG